MQLGLLLHKTRVQQKVQAYPLAGDGRLVERFA